jgi:signal transduction histidine kinase
MAEIKSNIQNDIDTISKIDAVSAILDVILKTTGMGFAVVARVTDKKWVACAVADEINFGLSPGGELVLETTLCNEVRMHSSAVVIEHATMDKKYCMHHTPRIYGIQSYISMPIFLKNGNFFGTLCAIDHAPAPINNPHTISLFKLFADLISFHINAVEELKSTEISLLEERKTAELRDQFIAILGHDLRNPIGAISNAAQLLLRIPDHERINKLAHIIQDSAYRVKNLIDNILDFAKGRMGDGIDVKITMHQSLDTELSQVISELQLSHPERIIDAQFKFIDPISCDGKRIAQLFSNLLANALTHGDKDAPITVVALSEHGKFKLSVSNAGEKIPKEKLNGLFKPFYRGNLKSDSQGLGLGLFIAQEIAIAHGGALKATSTEEETRFTLILS